MAKIIWPFVVFIRLLDIFLSLRTKFKFTVLTVWHIFLQFTAKFTFIALALDSLRILWHSIVYLWGEEIVWKGGQLLYLMMGFQMKRLVLRPSKHEQKIRVDTFTLSICFLYPRVCHSRFQLSEDMICVQNLLSANVSPRYPRILSIFTTKKA